MHRRSITVYGDAVAELSSALYTELTEERKGSVDRYDGDGFGVIVVERYYLRNNSDQQATIIFDRLSEERSRVTVISGGGGAGLLQLSLGSHSSQTEKLMERIVELCDSEEFQLNVTS